MNLSYLVQVVVLNSLVIIPIIKEDMCLHVLLILIRSPVLSINDDHKIRLHSSGYDPIIVDCHDLFYTRRSQHNFGFTQRACVLLLRAYLLSKGLISSWKVIFKQVQDYPLLHLLNVLSSPFLILSSNQASPLSSLKIAQIGQRAENHYFGKPSGLMDQLTIANGGICLMDFRQSQ
jgi:galactokinase